MKKKNKEDKIITAFDYDFVKNKFENDGIKVPERLNEQSILNALENREQKRIPFVKSKAFKSAVSLVACVAIFAVSLSFAFNKNNEQSDIIQDSSQTQQTKNNQSELETFSSASEVKAFFKIAQKANGNSNGGIYKGAENSDTASFSDVSSSSETYLQVSNVDEADTIKNDGKYIYTINEDSSKILIYKPNGDSVTKISEISAESSCIFQEFYIYNNNLVVNSCSNDGNEEYENVLIFSLENIKKPQKIYSFSQQGFYVDSRITNDKLLLISNKYIYADLCKSDEDYLPKTKTNDTEKCVEPNNIYRGGNGSANYLLVSQIDLQNLKKSAVTKAVAGSASTVYCSENYLYVASKIYETSNQTEANSDVALVNEKISTEIYKIDIKNEIKFLKKAKVSGWANNQFSMDEYNDTFRIATTVTGSDFQPINKLFILDSNMKKIGEVDGFAKNESIKAVRFMGNTAYVITFKNTDPLFVIDLSNSAKPIIKGSVKITGFSSNLIPVNSTTLLGIGYGESGLNLFEDGVKTVLFDVSNPEKPTILDTKEFDNVLSEAQSNHKAILTTPNSNKFAIPYEEVAYVDNEITDDKAGTLVLEIKDNKINVTAKSSSKIKFGNIVRSTKVDGIIYTFNSGEFVNSLQTKN